MSKYYDEKYSSDGLFWGKHPSTIARIFSQNHWPQGPERLLDAGCGEGRDSIFFAQAGYKVTAFDASAVGVEKTAEWAKRLNLPVEVTQADVNEYRLQEPFDVVLASGVFHYVQTPLRDEVIDNYKAFTRPGGMHAVLVPVVKPFVVTDPEADKEELTWHSGEILTHYHDWRIEFFEERIVPEGNHQFAMNLLVAVEPSI
jgi:tellurite methyltransferase